MGIDHSNLVLYKKPTPILNSVVMIAGTYNYVAVIRISKGFYPTRRTARAFDTRRLFYSRFSTAAVSPRIGPCIYIEG